MYEELHAGLLKLLTAFRDICEAEDIWYSLGYGSVLGAVRYKGFIPWDTDADVLIMLPDKERFREAFQKHKPVGIGLKCHDKVDRCLQSHDTLLFEKEDGEKAIVLDIYPLVGAPSDKKSQKKFTKVSFYQDRIIRSKYVDITKCKKKNVPLVLGAKILTSFIPNDVLRRNIYNREHRFDFVNANYLVPLVNYGKADNCIRKEVFNDTIEVPFEDTTFKIPKDWDTYLRSIYGSDYMIPKVY